ncbi:hypothetical protein ANO14919_088920 [Xylariales sp. No.14919]|nr:hypothetical protein ANO14919_088920 [Xylariales sp. No.14919]
MADDRPKYCAIDCQSKLESPLWHDHNLGDAFSAIIPDIVAATPDDPDLFGSPGGLGGACLGFTLQLVGGSRPLIVSPSDIPAHWDGLAQHLGLDGTVVRHDPGRRDRMRGAYTRGVVRGAPSSIPEPTESGSSPPTLIKSK